MMTIPIATVATRYQVVSQWQIPRADSSPGADS